MMLHATLISLYCSGKYSCFLPYRIDEEAPTRDDLWHGDYLGDIYQINGIVISKYKRHPAVALESYPIFYRGQKGEPNRRTFNITLCLN